MQPHFLPECGNLEQVLQVKPQPRWKRKKWLVRIKNAVVVLSLSII